VPSLRLVWVLHLFLLNLFIAYVALLAHYRNAALRRQGGHAVQAAPAPASARPVVVERRRPLPKPALAPVFDSRR
jgi:hypothetical protein